MYIVNIEGSDPFIAESEGAIYRGLDDLHDGKVIGKVKLLDDYYRIKYKTNTGQELNVFPHKSVVYK